MNISAGTSRRFSQIYPLYQQNLNNTKMLTLIIDDNLFEDDTYYDDENNH